MRIVHASSVSTFGSRPTSQCCSTESRLSVCKFRNLGTTCESSCKADPTCYGFIFKSKCPLIRSRKLAKMAGCLLCWFYSSQSFFLRHGWNGIWKIVKIIPKEFLEVRTLDAWCGVLAYLIRICIFRQCKSTSLLFLCSPELALKYLSFRTSIVYRTYRLKTAIRYAKKFNQDLVKPFCLRTRLNIELNFTPNFEGLVLGCIDADFCK